MIKYMISTKNRTELLDSKEASIILFHRLVESAQEEINHAFIYPSLWNRDIRNEVRGGNFDRFWVTLEIVKGEDENDFLEGFFIPVKMLAWTDSESYYNPEDKEDEE